MFDISICIPTFKRPKFLSETLNSVLLQQNERVEIVISDNASNDRTREVVAEYQEVFPNIKSHEFLKNEGIDKNIANLVVKSTGKYIFFVSDDDIVLPGTISKILKYITKFEPNIVYLNHFPFYGNLQNTRPPFLPQKNRFFNNGEQFFKYAGLGFLSSLILKRDAALKYIDTVVYGRECAHLDIACRIALKERGPFLFLGTIPIAARATPNLRYNPFDSCIFNQKKLFNELKNEKLLSLKGYKFLSKRLLLKDFLKIFLGSSISEDQKKLLFLEVVNGFSEYRVCLSILKYVFRLKNNQKSLLYVFLKIIFKKVLWLKNCLTA